MDCRDHLGQETNKNSPQLTHTEGGWCEEVVGHKLSQFSVCVRREAGECKKVDTLNIFSFQSRFEYNRIWVQINGCCCIFPYLNAVNLMSIVHIYVCVSQRKPIVLVCHNMASRVGTKKEGDGGAKR